MKGTQLGGYGAVEQYARDVGAPLPHWKDHPPDSAIPENLGGLVYTIDQGNGLEVWSKVKGEDPVPLGGGGSGSSKWSENSSGALEPKDGQPVTVEESVTVQDSGTDPSENGEVRNNGGKVKTQTDGSVGELIIGGDNDPLTIPQSASTAGPTDVAIGQNASAGTSGGESSQRSVAVGDNAVAESIAVAVGEGAEATGATSGALGSNAVADSEDAFAFGVGADATATGAHAMGRDTVASANDAIAIGRSVTTATANVSRIGGAQFVFGATRDTIADADLNNGEMTAELDESNSAFRLRGKDSSGTVREATVAW